MLKLQIKEFLINGKRNITALYSQFYRYDMEIAEERLGKKEQIHHMHGKQC